MSPVEVQHLPHDIPVAPLDRVGYAASVSRRTSLMEPFLDRCDRVSCPLRGHLVPELGPASTGLHETARIARAKANASGTPEYGFLFRVEVHARVAMPSPSMAAWLRAQTGNEVWNALRPFAEQRDFDGVLFPSGLILFDAARAAGALSEEYVWCVKSHGDLRHDRGASSH